MKPVIKYQGGKSKELPLIKSMLPQEFDRVVEPFCGGAAVSFGLECPAILSDINPMVYNLYKVIQCSDYFELQQSIDIFKTYEHDALQVAFYAARNVVNGQVDVSAVKKAISYVLVRQLCFSGMERYNAKGEFNVPFGHYKKLSCNLSLDHHYFLSSKCEVYHQSFQHIFDMVNENDFVFVDPPYLERLGYTEGDGGDSLHKELLGCLKATKAKWMLIHSDHPFYRENYSDYHILDKDHEYAQRFGKNKNHSGAKVKHLYITNYNP